MTANGKKKKHKSLMTDEVRSLIGTSTKVMELYGTVDKETIRRLVHGIPDQDPIYWDENASDRFPGVVAPPPPSTAPPPSQQRLPDVDTHQPAAAVHVGACDGTTAPASRNPRPAPCTRSPPTPGHRGTTPTSRGRSPCWVS